MKRHNNIDQKTARLIYWAVRELNEIEDETSDIFSAKLENAKALCAQARVRLFKDGDFYYCG